MHTMSHGSGWFEYPAQCVGMYYYICLTYYWLGPVGLYNRCETTCFGPKEDIGHCLEYSAHIITVNIFGVLYPNLKFRPQPIFVRPGPARFCPDSTARNGTSQSNQAKLDKCGCLSINVRMDHLWPNMSITAPGGSVLMSHFFKLEYLRVEREFGPVFDRTIFSSSCHGASIPTVFGPPGVDPSSNGRSEPS